MNKKILISLCVIGAVAAIAVGGTIAYFSDTETSTGNTFTAGSIDLKIDSIAHYNGMVCVNSHWQAESNYTQVANQYPVAGTLCTGSFGWKDLTSGDKFFSYVDVKPGDMGENTISMHVINNDAWACMKVNNLTSIDNGFTEPEQVVDTNTAKGELDETMYVFGWLDTNGDNIYQSSEKTLFGPGKAMDVLNNKTYTIADSITGTPLTGDPTGVTPYHVGMQWCAGTMSYNPSSGKLVCDGATMGNAAQTDIMTADVAFDVVQSRNNPNFRCVPPVHVTKSLNYGPTGWGGMSCPANTTVVDGSLVVTGGDLYSTVAWKPAASIVGINNITYTFPATPWGYSYGAGETGFIGQNDNDSGETIYLDFDCMPN
jgi:predicted ribosomally synthesized peptide with SipW-like signal peptide